MQISPESTWVRSVFNKVKGLRAWNFIKKGVQHMCFAVNFAKFLRIPFLQSTSSGCFCTFKNSLNSIKLEEKMINKQKYKKNLGFIWLFLFLFYFYVFTFSNCVKLLEFQDPYFYRAPCYKILLLRTPKKDYMQIYNAWALQQMCASNLAILILF